jgi:hypothetical protein
MSLPVGLCQSNRAFANNMSIERLDKLSTRNTRVSVLLVPNLGRSCVEALVNEFELNDGNGGNPWRWRSEEKIVARNSSHCRPKRHQKCFSNRDNVLAWWYDLLFTRFDWSIRDDRKVPFHYDSLLFSPNLSMNPTLMMATNARTNNFLSLMPCFKRLASTIHDCLSVWNIVTWPIEYLSCSFIGPIGLSSKTDRWSSMNRSSD